MKTTICSDILRTKYLSPDQMGPKYCRGKLKNLLSTTYMYLNVYIQPNLKKGIINSKKIQFKTSNLSTIKQIYIIVGNQRLEFKKVNNLLHRKIL